MNLVDISRQSIEARSCNGQMSDNQIVLRQFQHELASMTRESLAATMIVTTLAGLNGLFPGHIDGGIWPLYIPEHYGKRNSQHLLDPYSFVHFGHGLISFYVWGTVDQKEEQEHLDQQFHFEPDGKSLQSHDRISSGLIQTLFAALGFEMLENSQNIIELFRENSGTSEFYRGDSAINVFGDLLSCAMGYSTANFIANSWDGEVFYFVPIFLFLFIEVILALIIRDNLALIILQLFAPNEKIKEWQQEIIPTNISDDNDILKMETKIDLSGYWRKKYKSRKFGGHNEIPRQSFLNPRVFYMRELNITSQSK